MNACCQELEQKLQQALKRIQELEERLNQNSKNSSKPPSQDQKKSKEPPRKGGAKPGHPGHYRQLLPPDQIDFLGIRLSIGSVSNIEGQTSKLLKSAYEIISHEVLKGKVIHLDKTGWRESGQNHFVWVASCVNAVFYRIDLKRNREARDKLLGKNYHKLTVTDRYGVYNDLEGAHQYCLAHFKRELKRFSDRTRYDEEWGARTVEILDKVFHHWGLYRRGKISRAQLKNRCLRQKSELKDLLIVVGVVMPQGDKSKYSSKQKKQAHEIEKSYKKKGFSDKKAARIGWSTVNKQTGGARRTPSSRGK